MVAKSEIVEIDSIDDAMGELRKFGFEVEQKPNMMREVERELVKEATETITPSSLRSATVTPFESAMEKLKQKKKAEVMTKAAARPDEPLELDDALAFASL